MTTTETGNDNHWQRQWQPLTLAMTTTDTGNDNHWYRQWQPLTQTMTTTDTGNENYSHRQWQPLTQTMRTNNTYDDNHWHMMTATDRCWHPLTQTVTITNTDNDNHQHRQCHHQHRKRDWQEEKSDLDDLLYKPGHGLQLSLGNVVFQRLQEDAIVRLGQLHSREQVWDDAIEQRHILHTHTHRANGITGECQNNAKDGKICWEIVLLGVQCFVLQIIKVGVCC